ncbi:MAG: Gfo/Idh/MocA family oxidoreductase [Ruminococcaceae bacterium]|nr:Gfo/Idh/MocA family oxidoreductase [Oscillospiraceae bacterium]
MKILLVGAGGYASGYVKSLLGQTDSDVIWEGVVDPYFSSCDKKEDIAAAGIPVYSTMEDFYRERQADLAIICTPPFLHREQSICALSHGSYVLCEKPAAPTVEDVRAMLEAEKKYGKWIAIGYQWSFSRAIQDLKKDILSGVLGGPLSFKTAISWPRDLAYYGRGTGWAGKISKDGVIILDSIASNACAHYLHNMLFLLGDRMDTSAEVSEIEASCFRANNIENFDTCSIKMKANGIPLYFIASHAAKKKKNPEFIYQFENASVEFSQDEGAEIKAIFRDGTVKYYGDPFKNTFTKLWDCVDAIREGILPICTAKTALPHVKLIERMYHEVPIHDFPNELIRFDDEKQRFFVEGLYEKIYMAYNSEELLPF